jgi:hypothetical protein
VIEKLIGGFSWPKLQLEFRFIATSSLTWDRKAESDTRNYWMLALAEIFQYVCALWRLKGGQKKMPMNFSESSLSFQCSDLLCTRWIVWTLTIPFLTDLITNCAQISLICTTFGFITFKNLRNFPRFFPVTFVIDNVVYLGNKFCTEYLLLNNGGIPVKQKGQANTLHAVW